MKLLILSLTLSLWCVSVVQVFGSALSSSDSSQNLQNLLQHSGSGSESYVSLQQFQDLEKRMTEMEKVHEELMKLKQGLEAEKQNNEFTRKLFNLCSESEASFRANAKGAPGEKGDRGDSGQDGKKGEKGERGPQGPKGDSGGKGDKGNAGKDGEEGQAGQTGSKGDSGQNGYKGEKGNKGDFGQKGEIGESGQDGKSGQKGEMGERGPQGPKGESGKTGEKGEIGESGQKGENGKNGESGQKGENGDIGQKGEIGQTGKPGGKGKIGQVGEKGESGKNGNPGIKGELGRKGEPGEKGQRGEVGLQGPPDPKLLISCSAVMDFDSLSSPAISSSSRNETRLKKKKIYPYGKRNFTSLDVLCDLKTDGGGWTIIQKRSSDPEQEFNRTWSEYVRGFGPLNKNFWLGLDNIHTLTKNGDQELRIELQDYDGNKAWAKYSNFSVADASDFYRLSISGYSGNSTAGDSMTNPFYPHHVLNGMQFSTADKDNDQSNVTSCAGYHGGGWWFNDCFGGHLNGLYGEDEESFPPWIGIIWSSWKGSKYSLAKTEMKIRPQQSL